VNLLSADIGGTKTLLEISTFNNGQLTSLKKNIFLSQHYPDFDSLLNEFIQPKDRIYAACLAIAGPIMHNSSEQTSSVTNLPWQMNNVQLQKTFNIAKVHFINDFQAIGYAIEHLPNEDLTVLQHGQPKIQGIRAIIGAGTGLGEAILVHRSTGYEVLATEGGHSDFAATDELEFSLHQTIRKKHKRVSYENILSGPGLVTLYDFFSEREKVKKNTRSSSIFASNDPAAAISQAVNDHSCPIAVSALSLFMKIYGAKAGNLALNCLPFGGLYISGGIAGKNLSFLKNSDFIHAFNNKAPMQSLLKDIPIYLISTPEAGLIGATRYALAHS